MQLGSSSSSSCGGGERRLASGGDTEASNPAPCPARAPTGTGRSVGGGHDSPPKIITLISICLVCGGRASAMADHHYWPAPPRLSIAH